MSESRDERPESYSTNSKKEQLLLSYCDNFTRQFKKLYGDRKPQFLRPVNECGVEVNLLSIIIAVCSCNLSNLSNFCLCRSLYALQCDLLACITKNYMTGMVVPRLWLTTSPAHHSILLMNWYSLNNQIYNPNQNRYIYWNSVIVKVEHIIKS